MGHQVGVISPAMEIGLRFVGLFPGVTKNWGFAIILLISVINVPFQIWNATEVYRDVDRFMSNFGPTLIMLNCSIKLVAFRLSHRAVKYLINEICDDFVSFEKSNVSKVMAKHLKTSHSIYKIIAISYNSVITWRFVMSGQSYNKTKSIEHTDFLMPATYPYITINLENYIVINTFLLFQMLIAANGHSIIEGLLAFAVLHAATQVHNIRLTIKRYSELCCKTTDKATINAALKDLLFCHQKYLKFAINVEKAFSYIALSQLALVTLQICVVEYAILTAIENDSMTTEGYLYLNLLIADICGVATYCAAGQYFIIQSENIYKELCQCPWYKFQVHDLKSILMMMPTLQRPPVITFGKLGSLSLFCLMNIFKASFSYLSVFRAMKTKQRHS